MINENIKKSVIKLWNQKCEKGEVVIMSDIKDIKKMVSLNILDNYITDNLNLFINRTKKWYFDVNLHSFKEICYKGDVGDKFISISEVYFDMLCNKYFYITPNCDINLLAKTIPELNILFEKNNIIFRIYNMYEALSDNRIRIFFSLKLLTYDNIYIPLTPMEYKELEDYMFECKKMISMEDVYRNLTLLSPSEYREFLIWKKLKGEKIDI